MYTQENRLIAINTPLAKDTLLLKSFHGQEGISQLYAFGLNLFTEGPAIPVESILGQPVSLQVKGVEKHTRYFHGYISQFAQASSEAGVLHYRAEMVPWLWFLTRTTDCRMFQHKTIPQIIEQVFQDLGFADYTLQLQGTYEPLDYCVQYQETDFQFVSRLMEQVGIYYFFQHRQEAHTLILTDAPSDERSCPGQAVVNWEAQDGGLQEEEVVTHLERVHSLQAGQYALADYNYESPTTRLGTTIASVVNMGGNSKYEIFEFPGGYGKKAQGEQLVRMRMEEQEAATVVFKGMGTCRALTPGYHFDLRNYLPADMNQKYLITEVQHMASVSETYTTDGGGDQVSYSNQFVCIPQAVPFRPARVTPKPVVQGPQTAVVVGKTEEEIWTDKYGRVKVQFHWDRRGQHNEDSSCWIRVAQSWAGKGWGAMFLPRVGQEVIVEFLEGDPDQPIITGCVYNAQNMPPYELSAHQTVSGLKTCSSKGGQGCNEIRFDDKKGQEQLFFQAERNHDVRVKNNAYTSVGRDTHSLVTQDQIEEIQNDHHETIARDRFVEVGRDHNLKIKGKNAMEIKGSHSFMVKGDAVEVFKGNHAEETTGEVYVKGANLILEGMSSITIQVGGSYIAIDASGISIKGTNLVEVSAPTTTVQGDGELTLQGGLVKIN